jgi:ferredoxin
MIVASSKPLDEIKNMLKGYKNILIAACGTCVTVCLSGGEKEANELKALLELSDEEKNITVITPKRQCDMEFLEDFESEIEKADIVLSLACGAGVQFMAEHFRENTLYPGLIPSLWALMKTKVTGLKCVRAVGTVLWKKQAVYVL